MRTKITVAIAMAVTALVIGALAPTPASASNVPSDVSLPTTASGGDPAVRSCVDGLNASSVDGSGRIVGASPASCSKAVTPSENEAATGSAILGADTPVLPQQPTADVVADPCSTYVPPSVTITPAHPAAGGTYEADGFNWPVNSWVFGYAIGFDANGFPLGPFGIAFVFTNGAGQFVLNRDIDVRPVVYYDVYFISLECPSTTVQLRVVMDNTGGNGTTSTAPGSSTSTSSTSSSSTTSSSTTSTPGSSTSTTAPTAVLAAQTGAGPNDSGTGVLGESVARTPSSSTSRSSRSSSSSSGGSLATTGGEQGMLMLLALAMAGGGWLLLMVSRRRRTDGS